MLDFLILSIVSWRVPRSSCRVRPVQTTDNGSRLEWDASQQKGSESTAHEDTLQRRDREEVIDVPDEPEGKWIHWPTLISYVGPGFLVCIAYLDPGNLEADLQVQSV